MTTDILQLDRNYNSIIQEEKINPFTREIIYKNNKRYKHNDIQYIPNLEIIQEAMLYINPLPKRYTDITGTKRFKEIKDFFLTFNLLQQYLAPHSEDKSLVALDRRYIMKALGNRVHNRINKFFCTYFKLEIKGKEGEYTSGYSITEKGLKHTGKKAIAKVVHKDKLDNIIISIINNNYKEEEIVNIDNIKIEDAVKIVNNASIEIPEENIKMLSILDSSFDNTVRNIRKNYIDGRLYYNKSVKPYGRTYSGIHNMKKEARKILFQGFTEFDINSAAQSILARVYKGNKEIPYMLEYINNKDDIRKEISKDLNISIKETKLLLQAITFSDRIPTIKQINRFKIFKKYPKALNNDFIKGLSNDFKTIDKYLRKTISKEDYKIIKDFKGRVTNVDIRVFTFQNIESKIMKRVQDLIDGESFHLHDAVYVKEVSDEERSKISKFMSDLGMFLSEDILVYRKCNSKSSQMKPIYLLTKNRIDYNIKEVFEVQKIECFRDNKYLFVYYLLFLDYLYKYQKILKEYG